MRSKMEAQVFDKIKIEGELKAEILTLKNQLEAKGSSLFDDEGDAQKDSEI